MYLYNKCICYTLTYLCVGVIDADIHKNHKENSNGDTKVTHQTPDLRVKKSRIKCSLY